MAKKIIWSDRAKAQLRAIEQQTHFESFEARANLIATVEGDVQRLQGIEPPEFRLRVGDCRLRFHRTPDAVEVISVKHRREVYR